MNQALLNSMTVAERRLVAETSRDAMAGLDEEALLALHSRIRRARSKYVSVYRRRASGAVVKRGGRGFSYPKNQRERGKAEVFERALASVSKEVGVRAARAAAELKAARLAAARLAAARLAAARSGGTGPSTAGARAASVQKPAASRPRGVKKTTGGLKKDASSRAAGARRQAKRDSR
jgi:hypothetical protein